MKQERKSPFYISTTEAASIMSVTRVTITNWCRKGMIPGAEKFGRDWAIPLDALQHIEIPRPGRPSS